ncbi:MAG: CHRD domain-containing protein [Candidatus Krumholzibacteria bacterium]|jgi:hypothetical protein|nr:CHRD domain-containing protein [Candidatus Krumholzibacteria bacterium]
MTSKQTHERLPAVAAVIVSVLLLGAVPASAEIEIYTTTLSSANEVPPNDSMASGWATLEVDTETLTAAYHVEFSGLSAPETGAHFHNAPAGVNGPVVFGLPLGSPKIGIWNMTPGDYDLLVAGSIYVNIHSLEIPGGEIRGQMEREVVGAEATTLTAVKGLFR